MTCSRCGGTGCPTCEGSGVVAIEVESVTFAEAVELVYRTQSTGQVFHFLHGRPKLVELKGRKVKITA